MSFPRHLWINEPAPGVLQRIYTREPDPRAVRAFGLKRYTLDITPDDIIEGEFTEVPPMSHTASLAIRTYLETAHG